MNRLVAATFAAAAMGVATCGHAAEVYDQPLTEEPAATEEAANPANAGFDNLYHIASSLPEPMNWAMMIIGFGAAGQILRRRRAMGHF
ncbi:MAG TPA: PEPxxWA-CTERM sorting domain-containing protein [Phenylobacterium sp.]|nr:PEPxxWA-CTERM sorting domain-containing protein [Phenylobacterium sp.]